jgi:hypothetical protein
MIYRPEEEILDEKLIFEKTDEPDKPKEQAHK